MTLRQASRISLIVLLLVFTSFISFCDNNYNFINSENYLIDEVNNQDNQNIAISSRSVFEQTRNTVQGGCWEDSFEFDSGINWFMTDHLNRSKGDMKIDTWKPRPFLVDSNTLALWHFDEGTGSTVNDASPNNNHGTI